METPTVLRNLTIAFLSLFTPPVPLESRCSYRYCFGLLDRRCFGNCHPLGNGRERHDQRIRSPVMVRIVLVANWVRATGPFAHTGALNIGTVSMRRPVGDTLLVDSDQQRQTEHERHRRRLLLSVRLLWTTDLCLSFPQSCRSNQKDVPDCIFGRPAVSRFLGERGTIVFTMERSRTE